MARVTIIGAGLSGLVAANELSEAGHEVVVYDKGRGVGGRMATRRVSDARVDHGAQFFTVRGDDFRAVVDRAIAAGAVSEWCRGFGEPDGYPRYCGTEGMTSFPKFLATGLDVRLGRRIRGLDSVAADAYVVTAPIPQALELLRRSGLTPAHELLEQLTAIRYNRTIAAMFVLDGPSGIHAPGAVQQADDALVTFAADNKQKGISSVPAVTIHMSNEWSTKNWDRSDEELEGDLLEYALPYMGEAIAYDFEIHKWRYAGPQNPFSERCCVTSEEPLVVLAGDSFAGPKVEGAFNSGLAAGREVSNRLS